MPFFQNPFTADFEGNLVLGDRQHIPKFVVPFNAGRGDEYVTAWVEGPYNLSGNDGDSNPNNVLKFKFSINNFKNWTDLSVTISASSLAATTVPEIVTSLEANSTFTSFFNVYEDEKFPSGTSRLVIRQKKPNHQMRFFVVNGRAEEVIRFNQRAGVAEIPEYFARHTVANLWNYTDCAGMLVALNTSLNVDQAVIEEAYDKYGRPLNYTATEQEDWELLRGRSGSFNFQKITVDGSNRITQIIEYPAGALAGDFARKINYSYTAANTNPDQITEIPYVLQSGDLVTP